MNMIREADLLDIERLVLLGSFMHREAEPFHGLRFDAARLANTLAHVIESPNGFAWVAEDRGVVVGGLMAMVTPHWFSPDTVACDLALFMLPEHRGTLAPVRLINAYAAWGHDIKAVKVQLGVMTGVDPETTIALLERLGWHRAGVVMEI